MKCFWAGCGAAGIVSNHVVVVYGPIYSLPLFLFQTCIGSGPDAPFLDPSVALLGPAPGVPLAAFATSLGLGAGGNVVPGFVGASLVSGQQVSVQPTLHNHSLISPFVLVAPALGVPAFARKFFVTDTALKVVGFLTELERAW